MNIKDLLKSIEITALRTMFIFIGSLFVNFLFFMFYKPPVSYYERRPVSDTTIKFFFEYMLGQPGKTFFTINLALLSAFIVLCLLYLFLDRFFNNKSYR